MREAGGVEIYAGKTDFLCEVDPFCEVVGAVSISVYLSEIVAENGVAGVKIEPLNAGH